MAGRSRFRRRAVHEQRRQHVPQCNPSRRRWGWGVGEGGRRGREALCNARRLSTFNPGRRFLSRHPTQPRRLFSVSARSVPLVRYIHTSAATAPRCNAKARHPSPWPCLVSRGMKMHHEACTAQAQHGWRRPSGRDNHLRPPPTHALVACSVVNCFNLGRGKANTIAEILLPRLERDGSSTMPGSSVPEK